MSYFSQFAGGPAKVTQYTSGSGNYTPISTNLSWARVTVVGGGAGGSSGNGANNLSSPGWSGGAGATKVEWIKLNEATYSYAVGSGGGGGAAGSANKQAGNSGSRSYFGQIVAQGGRAWSGSNASQGPFGGTTQLIANMDSNGIFYGYSGGEYAGGSGIQTNGGETAGAMYGIPYIPTGTNYGNLSQTNITNFFAGRGAAGNTSDNTRGGTGGGDSYYGMGGAGGNGTAQTRGGTGSAGSGYGAGGGAGGNGYNEGGAGGGGSGGLIIVEEFIQS